MFGLQHRVVGSNGPVFLMTSESIAPYICTSLLLLMYNRWLKYLWRYIPICYLSLVLFSPCSELLVFYIGSNAQKVQFYINIRN